MFSGSSKDAEFRSLGVGGNVVICNDGLPINFRYQSLPAPIAEHLFLTLMFAILQAKNQPRRGITPLGEELQAEASRIWLDSKRYLGLFESNE